jgi:hypothetical protein
MRFPYFQLSSTDFAPIISLKILGKEGWVEFEAYVDSGASFSIFGIERAEILGIDYKKGKSIYLTVGDGGLIEVYLHKLKVEFGNRQFIAEIGFSKQLGVQFNLLGRKDFFDRFCICFNDKDHYLEITPLEN